jgi:hypothetical protein
MIKFDATFHAFELLKYGCRIPPEAILERIEKRIIEIDMHSTCNGESLEHLSDKVGCDKINLTNTVVWVGTFVHEQSVWELVIDNNRKLIRVISTD